MTSPAKRGPLGFLVIGLFKTASGVLLLALGFGIFRLLNRDLGDTLEDLVTRLHLDPDNRFIQSVLERLSGIDRRHLKAIGAGTFVYAALHLVEGIGLILRRRWAGYLTIIATSSLLPVEVYEIWKKPGPARVLVFLVNVGFVGYIIYKFKQESRIEAPIDKPI